MKLADITATDIQDEVFGPNILDEYREQETKRMKDDKYMNLLSRYTRSIFQNLKNFSEQKLILLKMILNWF